MKTCVRGLMPPATHAGRRAGVASACLAFCLVVLTPGSYAATSPIYKCLDKHLGLLYTDEPCKDGEEMNIRAGDADPVAVARLERQRDALDQSASQRIADLRRPLATPNAAPRLPYEPVDEGESYAYGPAYGSGYGIVSQPVMHHHHRMGSRRPGPRMHHFAPTPPYYVPRR